MPAAPRRKIALFNFHPAFVPPGSGGEARCFHVWRGLAERFDVEAVTPTFPEAGAIEVVDHAPGLRETRVPKKEVHVRWHQRLGRFKGLPECSALVVALAGAKDPEFMAAAERAMDGADVVVLENPFLPFIKPKPGQLVVYESFNVECLLQRENGSGLAGAWAERKTRRLESALAKRCDILFACSPEDQRLFVEELGAAPHKVFVAPNGFDLVEAPEPLFDEAEKDRLAVERFGAPDPSRPRVAFLGSRFPTNTQAMRHIVEEIAPGAPEIDFYLAGKCVEELGPNRPRNVVPVGWLDDAKKADFLRMAHAAINPVSGGSGTNVKMLDFLGAGLPIVASPVGARGLELVNGSTAFIAERRDMPRVLRDLAASPSLRRRVGLAGRRHAAERFQWKGIASGMADAIEHHLAPRRVATLVDYPIHPVNHGGKARVAGQAEALAERGWAVTILSLNKNGDAGARMLGPGVMEATVSRDPAHNALDARLQRAAGGICLDDLTCFTDAPRLKAYAASARALAAKSQALILSHPYLAEVARQLKREFPALPILHDAHNFEFALKRAMLEKSRLAEGLKPDARKSLVESFEKCEAAALSLADAVAATSDADLRHLREHYALNGAAAFVAPNAARVRATTPASAQRRAALRAKAGVPAGAFVAAFLGSAHLPNADAAEFIVRDLAPAAPDVCFFIVGGVSEAIGHLNAPPNVRLFPMLADERKSELLAMSDAALNPVDQGSGTNLKLLEFLALGLPVVSTSVGARGIDARDGEDLIVAERPAMARALSLLAADPARRERLGRAGRALAERLYDWSVAQKAVGDWLESLPSPSVHQGG
jgi:glycosyltransferase involved in cell wall biosynthesis